MGEFFELRIYQVFPGKMTEWLELMENIIIPFQVSKGMIIHGSFTETSFDRFHLSNGKRDMETLENRNLYIWIRRFENTDHKQKLYKKVYESDEWMNNIAPNPAKIVPVNVFLSCSSIPSTSCFSIAYAKRTPIMKEPNIFMKRVIDMNALNDKSS